MGVREGRCNFNYFTLHWARLEPGVTREPSVLVVLSVDHAGVVDVGFARCKLARGDLQR